MTVYHNRRLKLAMSDDSSYEVNSDDPVEKPETPQPPKDIPSSTKKCSEGKCCCKCLEKFKPQNIKATLDDNAELVKRIQSVLMLRRPIAFAVVLVVINFHFIMLRTLNLSLYPFIIFCAMYSMVYRILKPKVAPMAEKFLFGTPVPDGEASETNRIRSNEEVAAIINKVTSPIVYVANILAKIANDQSIVSKLVWVVILVCAFVLTASVDFFKLASLLINALLIVPGVLCHPKVAALIAQQKENLAKKVA